MNKITEKKKRQRGRPGLGRAYVLALAGVLLASGWVSADEGTGGAPAAKSYFEVGRTQLASGDTRQALSLLAAATIAGPDTQAARRYLLGLINQQCFNWKVEELEGALPVLPHYPPLLECLGRRYEGQGRYNEAEAMYRRWAAAGEDLAEPYARLGELYAHTGRHAEALAAFDRHRQMRGDGYPVRRMAAVAAAWAESFRPKLPSPPENMPVPRPTRLAAGNDPQAQFGLAVRYQYGLGVGWDPTLAAEAYARAARSGHRYAQLRLAHMLQEGEGVAQNPEEAVAWLSSAAEGGMAQAQFYLAVACLTGNGTNLDLSRAVTWGDRAAAQGLPDAQFLLGLLHRYGIGTPKDPEVSAAWLMKASAMFLEAGRWQPGQQALAAASVSDADAPATEMHQTARGAPVRDGETMP